MIRPPSLDRESMTLSLSSLQKGHLTGFTHLTFTESGLKPLQSARHNEHPAYRQIVNPAV